MRKPKKPAKPRYLPVEPSKIKYLVKKKIYWTRKVNLGKIRDYIIAAHLNNGNKPSEEDINRSDIKIEYDCYNMQQLKTKVCRPFSM